MAEDEYDPEIDAFINKYDTYKNNLSSSYNEIDLDNLFPQEEPKGDIDEKSHSNGDDTDQLFDENDFNIDDLDEFINQEQTFKKGEEEDDVVIQQPLQEHAQESEIVPNMPFSHIEEQNLEDMTFQEVEKIEAKSNRSTPPLIKNVQEKLQKKYSKKDIEPAVNETTVVIPLPVKAKRLKNLNQFIENQRDSQNNFDPQKLQNIKMKAQQMKTSEKPEKPKEAPKAYFKLPERVLPENQQKKVYPDYIRSWRTDPNLKQQNNFTKKKSRSKSKEKVINQQRKKSVERYQSKERVKVTLAVLDTKEQKIEYDIKQIDTLYDNIKKKIGHTKEVQPLIIKIVEKPIYIQPQIEQKPKMIDEEIQCKDEEQQYENSVVSVKQNQYNISFGPPSGYAEIAQRRKYLSEYEKSVKSRSNSRSKVVEVPVTKPLINYVQKQKDLIQYHQLAPEISPPKQFSLNKFIESAEHISSKKSQSPKKVVAFHSDSSLAKYSNSEILHKLQQKLFQANNLTLDHPVLKEVDALEQPYIPKSIFVKNDEIQKFMTIQQMERRNEILNTKQEKDDQKLLQKNKLKICGKIIRQNSSKKVLKINIAKPSARRQSAADQKFENSVVLEKNPNPMAGKIKRQQLRKRIENLSFENINENINNLSNGICLQNQSQQIEDFQSQAQEFTDLISTLKNECQISFQTNRYSQKDFMSNFDYKAKPLRDKKKSKLKRLQKIEKSVDSKLDKQEYYRSYKSSSKKYRDLVKDPGFTKYLTISEEN